MRLLLYFGIIPSALTCKAAKANGAMSKNLVVGALTPQHTYGRFIHKNLIILYIAAMGYVKKK